MSWSNSNLEARITLISVLLLCSSLHSFRVDVSLIVTVIAVVFSRGRVLIGLKFFIPLITLFIFWSFLLGGIDKLPTLIALIAIGLLVMCIKPEDIAYALMYFKIPPRIAYSICIAIRLLHISLIDLRNISAVLSIESGLSKYVKLLKALTSVLILRSYSIAESLYSRGFNLDRKVVLVRKPKLFDWLLLVSSIAVFIYSLKQA